MTKGGVLLALDRDGAKRVFGSRDESVIRQAVAALQSELEGGSRCLVLGEQYAQLGAFENGDAGSQAEPPPALRGGRSLDGDSWSLVLVRPDMISHIAKELERIPSPSDAALADLAQDVIRFYAEAGERRDAVLFVVSAS